MSQKQHAEKALRLKRANERRRLKAAALDFSDYPDRLLTPLETAELLGVGVQTLSNWRWAGKGPRFVRINRQTPFAIRARPSRSSPRPN